MHLLIDIRFYRPEPFGLAIHIRDLFTELTPLLAQNPIYQKVTLVLDQQNQNLDLHKHLSWWSTVTTNPKFKIYYSTCRYYSLAEQTKFLWELYRLKPDLVFFFNFNYPILYRKPFVYQVLDLTIVKTKPPSLKKWLAELVLQTGLRQAKHVFFLGNQTKVECEQFSRCNFSNPNQPGFKPNTCLYLGVNPLYLTQPSANPKKSQIIGINFNPTQQTKAEELKTELNITKPYFLFVSVWRKYKNLERLIQAFADFNNQHNNQYQLVIAGKPDPEYPEILEQILINEQHRLGNLILAIERPDSDLILLQDQALAYVFPSLSEGFGLTLLEAASRGTLIACSNIPIFRDILPASGVIFFDPYDTAAITQALHQIVSLEPEQVEQMTKTSFLNSQQYTWAKTAIEMEKVFASFAKQA